MKPVAEETKSLLQSEVGGGASRDKLDRPLDIFAGPIGMKIGEMAMQSAPPARSATNGRLNGSAPSPQAPTEARSLPRDVPDHFRPYASRMEEAESEEELAEALMFGLASLNLDARWQPAVRAAFRAMLADRPTETFVLTWDILDALVQGGHLRAETAQMAITTCRDSWDEVRGRVLAFRKQQAAE